MVFHHNPGYSTPCINSTLLSIAWKTEKIRKVDACNLPSSFLYKWNWCKVKRYTFCWWKPAFSKYVKIHTIGKPAQIQADKLWYLIFRNGFSMKNNVNWDKNYIRVPKWKTFGFYSTIMHVPPFFRCRNISVKSTSQVDSLHKETIGIKIIIKWMTKFSLKSPFS